MCVITKLTTDNVVLKKGERRVNKEEMQVLLINAVCTKSGKTLVRYAIPAKDTAYSKGPYIIDDWYDSKEIFDRVVPDTRPMSAKYVYEPGFNGSARMHITDLTNADGVVLLAE